MRPVNSVETDTGLSLICGAYAFEVYQDVSDTALSSAWLTIAEKPNSPGTYVMTADTTVDNTLLTNVSPASYNVQIKSYLVSYPTRKTYTAKTIEVTAATCVCSALLWDTPSKTTPTVAVATPATETIVLPTANTSNRANNAAFDACY